MGLFCVVLEIIESQARKKPASWIAKFELDLNARSVTRELISDGTPTDIPCIDPRNIDKQVRYIHILEAGKAAEDLLAFTQIACWDLKTREVKRAHADSGQVFGEMVFVPFAGAMPSEESQGWILHLGFDSNADESFLDIRRAVSMELEARVWVGRFLPLGFHGSFAAL